jgi:hypothetical protein
LDCNEIPVLFECELRLCAARRNAQSRTTSLCSGTSWDGKCRYSFDRASRAALIHRAFPGVELFNDRHTMRRERNRGPAEGRRLRFNTERFKHDVHPGIAVKVQVCARDQNAGLRLTTRIQLDRSRDTAAGRGIHLNADFGKLKPSTDRPRETAKVYVSGLIGGERRRRARYNERSLGGDHFGVREFAQGDARLRYQRSRPHFPTERWQHDALGVFRVIGSTYGSK